MKYPEGHFIGKGMAIGIAIGAGIGVPLSSAIGNPGMISIGLPIGLVLGLAMGKKWEEKAKKEGKIRPLTKKEKSKKKIGLYLGIGALIVGVILALTIFLLK